MQSVFSTGISFIFQASEPEVFSLTYLGIYYTTRSQGDCRAAQIMVSFVTKQKVDNGRKF